MLGTEYDWVVEGSALMVSDGRYRAIIRRERLADLSVLQAVLLLVNQIVERRAQPERYLRFKMGQ